MFQTELERQLENYLDRIGTPLRPRLYAEDLDLNAELEDTTSPVGSTDDPASQLMHHIASQIDSDQGGLTPDQFDRGEQPLLERNSEVFNGLGFQYTVSSDKYFFGEGGLSAREMSDTILSGREFGKRGSEGIVIVYNPDFADWSSNRSNRSGEERFYRFYGAEFSPVLHIESEANNKALVDKLFEEDEVPDRTANVLSQIIEFVQGKTMSSEVIRDLMGYFPALKESVS